MFERCVISKGVKTYKEIVEPLIVFERCVISKGVKTAGPAERGNKRV